MRFLFSLPVLLLSCVASAQIRFPTNPAVPATPPPAPAAPAPAPPAAPAQVPGQVAPAAAAVAIPSVSFEVKTMRTGGKSDLKLGGSSGGGSVASTLDRKKASELELEIGLRNFANREGAVTVEWFFFSTPEPGIGVRGNEILLFSQGTQEVLMKPGATEKVMVASGQAVTVESRRSEIQTRREGSREETAYLFSGGKTGQKIAGWLVRLRAGEKVLGFKASSPRFEVYGRDANALAALPGKDVVKTPKPNLGAPGLRPVDLGR